MEIWKELEVHTSSVQDRGAYFSVAVDRIKDEASNETDPRRTESRCIDRDRKSQ